LMQQCQGFLVDMGWLRNGETFFCSTPCREAPTFIVAWIMNACDSITLKGSTKPASVERGTYGHAQKMRAAMTYAFGRLHGLGEMSWHPSEVPGNESKMLGNPSVSVHVSSYM
ncbi:hypothetical protein BU15DRAFT_37458, partial [Melanogaster broomeanus]